MKSVLRILILPLLLTMGVLSACVNVNAAVTEPPSELGLRVKVEYIIEPADNANAEDQIVFPISDEWLDIDHSRWKKQDEYFYYDMPMRSGESAVFMQSFRIPAYIDSKTSGITFHIRITAEVFSILLDSEMNYPAADRSVRTVIREMEYRENELRPYTNNQVVVPGQRISKIVRIFVYDERQPVIRETEEQSVMPTNEETIIYQQVTVNVSPQKTESNRAGMSTNNSGARTAGVSRPKESVTAAGKITEKAAAAGRTAGKYIRSFLTGDDSNMYIWMITAAASIMLLLIYIFQVRLISADAVSTNISAFPKTTALLTDRDQVLNQFSTGEIRAAVTEDYDPPELAEGVNEFRKSVRILNTGTAPCYVRVFLSVSDSTIAQKTWFAASAQDAAAGNYVLSQEYYNALPAGWHYNPNDGYCYYTEALLPGQETVPLIYAVKTVFETADEVRPYEIIVYQEAIQTVYAGTEQNGSLPGYAAAWRAILNHDI